MTAALLRLNARILQLLLSACGCLLKIAPGFFCILNTLANDSLSSIERLDDGGKSPPPEEEENYTKADELRDESKGIYAKTA